ncbi:MAG TPA: hypothetical protein VGK23_04735 [Methanomassiliicoccales archaeon]|jgi:hypothetical protein
MGFETLVDGITQNLIGLDGALTKATDAVDEDYSKIKNRIEKLFSGGGQITELGNVKTDICPETIVVRVRGDRSAQEVSFPVNNSECDIIMATLIIRRTAIYCCISGR